jgi:hypothetical protein
MAVNYNEENLLLGVHHTRQVAMDAGTYYRGQRLAFNTDQMCDIGAGDTTLCGVFLGDGYTNPVTLLDADVRTVIVGGELQADGVVNSSGAAVVLTEAQKVAYQKLGFYFES